ncbi:MAG: efflux RND transporter periplasmic adaptor subunit [Firmicutes bacterium]|nr:efflux RND transporter periplasmic adaptor subunit [Bacillota bacterium]
MKNKQEPSKRKILWLGLGIFAVILVVLIFALPKRIDYTEARPVRGNLATYYSFSGRVEAKNRQTFLANSATQISSINVTEGQQVSPNTTLMTTATGQAIRSAISGKVGNIAVNANEQVMPGTKLLDVVDYSSLQLKVQIDENDLSAVSVGKDATVAIHALNKNLSSKITDVSIEGEYLNGVTNFTATLSLPAESDLRVGMSAEAKVLNQSVSGVIILPMAAIQFDPNNSPYVLLKNDLSEPKMTGVTIGINDGVNAEVKSGVTANDIVLVPPSAKCPSFTPNIQMQQGADNTTQGAGSTPQGSSGGGAGQ